MLQDINENLLLYLNSFLEYTMIEKATLFFADGPIFFLPVFLVWAWIYTCYKKEKTQEKKIVLLSIFYSTIIGICISLLIQQVAFFERPETVIEWVWKLILKHIPDASFPSDHATVSVAFLAGLFWGWYKKIAFVFLPFVILMNLSRVIVWVHWPFDIVVWTLVGIFWAWIAFRVLQESKLVKIVNQFIIKTLSYIKL